MRINPSKILPSQDFLKPSTVQFIFTCLQEGAEDELPPTPIVRQDKSGRLIAIDGHNLLAVRAFRDEIVTVHVAHDASDGFTASTQAVRSRNNELKQKFDAALSEQAKVAAEGITSFHDLIAKYPELFIDRQA